MDYERVDERWEGRRDLGGKGKGKEQQTIEMKPHLAETLLNFLLLLFTIHLSKTNKTRWLNEFQSLAISMRKRRQRMKRNKKISFSGCEFQKPKQWHEICVQAKL